MNHYWTSTGERVTQSTIDRRIREAKENKLEQQRLEYGYNFCEICKRNGNQTRLDCSHDIAVKKGNIEQAWDINNITIRCRKCHEEYGDGNTKL